MVKVPHDHADRGASFWTAIFFTLLYGGRVGGESSGGKGLVECIV